MLTYGKSPGEVGIVTYICFIGGGGNQFWIIMVVLRFHTLYIVVSQSESRLKNMLSVLNMFYVHVLWEVFIAHESIALTD